MTMLPSPNADVDRLVRKASKFLLRNSSEGTFDLQATLGRIGAPYGAKVEAMITMEGLTYVITHADGTQQVGAIHAQPSLERLDLISEFRILTDHIIDGELSADAAADQLEELEHRRSPSPWLARFLGVILFAAGFAPSMQANWRQLGASVILGAAMAAVYLIGERIAMLRTMLPLLGSLAVGVVGFGILHDAHAHGGPVLVMVPALFVMIPGDFLCAAAAEIAVGQFTVGTIRLVQSVFVLFQLAAGVIIAAAITGAGTHSLMQTTTVSDLPWIVLVVAWVPFTIGMALTFCARAKDVGWLLLGVYVAWGVQLLVTWAAGDAAGTFTSAAVLALMGVLLSQSRKSPPSLVIILGGVFVLTVGSMALRGITTAAGGYLIDSLHDMADFARVAGSLSLGLIVGTSIGVALISKKNVEVRSAINAER